MSSESADTILGPAETSSAAWHVFQPRWYAEAYPQIIDEVADTTPATLREHYLTKGRRQGLSPNMFFDEAWYLLRYPDVAEAVQAGRVSSGFDHYSSIGYRDRSPHWLFDDATYRSFSRDLTDATMRDFECANRYDHFLKSGMREHRIGHILFDPHHYRQYLLRTSGQADDMDAQGTFVHFLQRVVLSGLDADTSPYFDLDWYLDTYPEAQAAVDAREYSCALHHYLANPTPRLFNPRAEFSEDYYLSQTPEAAEAVRRGTLRSGYEHFLKLGVFEMRRPSPDINLHQYLSSNPKARSDVHSGDCRDAFLHMIRAGGAATARFNNIGHGFVDVYGYHTPSRGWMFCGWLHPSRLRPEQEAQVQATFADGQVTGKGLLAWHRRDDIGADDTGFTLHLPARQRPTGPLTSLAIESDDVRWVLRPSDPMPVLRDEALGSALKPILSRAEETPAVARLRMNVAKRGYSGANTLGELKDKVFLELDEAILCPPNGLLLIGWALMHPGTVAHVHVQSGHRSTPLRLDRRIHVDRPDVIGSVGAAHGFTDSRCGFICWVPDALTEGEVTCIELETVRGDTGFRGVPAPKLAGMAAIRFVLERFDARYVEVGSIYDDVVGPAVTALNAARVAQRPDVAVIEFGIPVASPMVSVIVPLYGRLDFMEYQFAFFSRHAQSVAIEYIYVLDDPAKRREAETLAAAIHARFGIPFRLAAMSRNMGFAPANNVGIGLARGEFVCLMNSDVFPGTPDWMERLLASLRANPDLGAIGPLLLFEDGSVQHQGMRFDPLPEFGNWLFPLHDRKGWRPPRVRGIERCAAITGAFVLMSRERLLALGGLDEGFVIGDFEDSDLCLKLRRDGLHCAVDLDVEMYHLERQSQAGSAQRWRMNLTLYNAWLHERRWGAALRLLQLDPAAELPAPEKPIEPEPSPQPDVPVSRPGAGVRRRARAGARARTVSSQVT